MRELILDDLESQNDARVVRWCAASSGRARRVGWQLPPLWSWVLLHSDDLPTKIKTELPHENRIGLPAAKSIDWPRAS